MILYESSYYGTVPLASNYLMHYQVKGAKHGVRRWQNYDGSLTPAGYIHYGVGQGHHGSHDDKSGTKQKSEVTDGDDYTVKKGASTQRFMTEKDEEVGDERKYVSVTDKDKQIYKDFYPKLLRDYGKAQYGIPDRVYETKLSTIKDMKVAGSNTYNNIFEDLYNDKSWRQKNGWEFTEKGKLYRKIFGKKLAELNLKEMQKARNNFDQYLGAKDREVNQEFFRRLKEAGYDAVEDQFSRRVDGTEGNLIVLDPKSSLKRTSLKEVKFTDDGKYDGTISTKTGDKQRKQAEKRKSEMDSEFQTIFNNRGDVRNPENAKRLQDKVAAFEKKYGLTSEQTDSMFRQAQRKQDQKRQAEADRALSNKIHPAVNEVTISKVGNSVASIKKRNIMNKKRA